MRLKVGSRKVRVWRGKREKERGEGGIGERPENKKGEAKNEAQDREKEGRRGIGGRPRNYKEEAGM